MTKRDQTRPITYYEEGQRSSCQLKVTKLLLVVSKNFCLYPTGKVLTEIIFDNLESTNPKSFT